MSYESKLLLKKDEIVLNYKNQYYSSLINYFRVIFALNLFIFILFLNFYLLYYYYCFNPTLFFLSKILIFINLSFLIASYIKVKSAPFHISIKVLITDIIYPDDYLPLHSSNCVSLFHELNQIIESSEEKDSNFTINVLLDLEMIANRYSIKNTTMNKMLSNYYA